MAENILKRIPKGSYKEDLKEVSWEAFENILSNRRSIRVFRDEKIPDPIVKRCLEAALLAPNSSNLQCWEFYWIKNQALQEKIHKVCLDQPAASTAPTLIVCVAQPQNWKKHSEQMLEKFKEVEASGHYVAKSAVAYYKKLVPFFYSQGIFSLWGQIKSVLYFFRGLKEATPREPTSNSELKAWAIKSCALACQNLMMAFSASGYDTCPMEGFDSSRLKKALKLNHGAVPVMVISAGKRAENGLYGPRIRFDSKNFIKIL